MPAALPGSTSTQNQANPSAGQFVCLDALSGPKGSPFDAKKPVYNATAGAAYVNDPNNISTGCLSTGIGFGSNHVINITSSTSPATAPKAISDAGFTDDMGEGSGANSIRVYIGGGRSIITGGNPPAGAAGCNPYTAGFAICGAGNGGSRDGGAGPTVFTGFTGKMVTATGTTANGAAIEAGFNNRSGVTMTINQSAFGQSTTTNAAPA